MALGMIEVYGFATAIVVADAMAKVFPDLELSLDLKADESEDTGLIFDLKEIFHEYIMQV